MGKPTSSRHNILIKQNYPLRFLIPAIAFLLVFFFIPTVLNFIYAFTNWSAFSKTISFNGLDNFITLFTSGTLLRDLRITLLYAIFVGIFQNVFGLALAVFLEKDTFINRLSRVLFFVPVIMSALAVGYIWQAILKSDGALNQILSAFSGHAVEIAWLGNINWTLLIVASIHGWKWMGLAMLIYLAGLKTIDPDVIEAATIDGASGSQLFWKIKFPLLAPAFTFNVATSLLGSMNGFDIVQATTQGGPGGSTEILNIFIWRTFGQGLYSQSTTMSLVLFVMVMVIAVPVIYLLRRREAKIL
ncbi:carbohydrate ABC transporter permease [Bifidobacterium miconisargentati]|uniref:carbohydrate ABC transporter permease n=1 Tax=Bifidobacterium miconisargentati TaxID=2834437 RepID=UPI001BDC9ABB|nr:sugar ABC transporter permease [Bifidobacterium miconisargentati]MBW3091154.1 sugar ABC transporter permease [Bifidobacterium miconisargentati]